MASMYDSSTEMLQRGFAGLGGVADAYAKKQEADAPLSPFEQSLMDVISGKKTPEQAAQEHRQGGQVGVNIAAARGPSQGLAPAHGGRMHALAATGEQPAGYNPGDDVPEVFAQPAGLSGGLQRGGGLGGPVASGPVGSGGGLSAGRPQTRRDLESLLKLGPTIGAMQRTRESNDVRREGYGVKREVAGLQEDGKNERAGSRVEATNFATTTRAGTADKDREARLQIAEAKRNADASNLSARLRHAEMRTKGTKNPRVKELMDQMRFAAQEAERARNHKFNFEKNMGASPEDLRAAERDYKEWDTKVKALEKELASEEGKQVIEVPREQQAQGSGTVRVLDENGRSGQISADKLDAWLGRNPNRKRQ